MKILISYNHEFVKKGIKTVMAKSRINNEGNIRLRSDGLYEVRITIGTDFMTGKQKRASAMLISEGCS